MFFGDEIGLIKPKIKEIPCRITTHTSHPCVASCLKVPGSHSSRDHFDFNKEMGALQERVMKAKVSGHLDELKTEGGGSQCIQI